MKKNKKLFKSSLVVLSTSLVFSGLAPSVSNAATSNTSSPTPASTQYPSVGQLTQAEINMFLNNGATYTDRSRSTATNTTGEFSTNNIVTSLAKKLAVSGLRKSSGYVEKGLSKVIGAKNASKAAKSFHKVADYIEKVQNVQESGIASILIQGGMPPDVAIETAKWIVLFFGL